MYQKDRLEEQVAEYEGVIKEQKPKVLELEQQLAGLAQQRTELNLEREQLRMELSDLGKQLITARMDKQKIEEQTQFMAFRYRMPDGKPATTIEQVQVAQDFELKKTYFSNLRTNCGWISRDQNVFPTTLYNTDDAQSDSFPFTSAEVKAWSEQGNKFPLNRAVSCVMTHADMFVERNKNYPRVLEIVTGLKAEVLRKVNSTGAKLWAPPFEPADAIKELAAKRADVRKIMDEEYKKSEAEWGGWKSVWGASKRAIYKSNYEVTQQNAKVKARSELTSLNWEYQKKANEFRDGLNKEVTRLIDSATKDSMQ